MKAMEEESKANGGRRKEMAIKQQLGGSSSRLVAVEQGRCVVAGADDGQGRKKEGVKERELLVVY